MAQPLAGHCGFLRIVTCSHLAEDQLFVPPSMGTSQRPCFHCGGDFLPHQAEHVVPCVYCAAPLHRNCEGPHVLKEHPSRPFPSCGLPPGPWTPLKADPRISGCAEGGKYFVHIPSAVTSSIFPPDVARHLPPRMVIPLEELRKMLLGKSENEDSARQSGAVDRQGGNQPSMIQLDEMD